MISSRSLSVFECFRATRYLFDNDTQKYDWSSEQVGQLIENLIAQFHWSFRPGDERFDCARYLGMSLGTICMRALEKSKSFLSGHQLFITITLLLIFLDKRMCGYTDRPELESLIYFDRYGQGMINPDIELYAETLESLLFEPNVSLPKESDPSHNLIARYNDIEDLVNEGVNNQAIRLFSDWVIHKVSLEVITAETSHGVHILQKADAYDCIREGKAVPCLLA